MKIRTFFLTWLEHQPLAQPYEIDLQRFSQISEREYVFEVLATLTSLYPGLNRQLQDFELLEQKRYHIIDAFKFSIEDIKDQVTEAIDFCAKTSREQRKFKFRVNPLLSKFLAQSTFQWYGTDVVRLSNDEGSYLFAPSVSHLPPKELVLDGLNTLLLDLKDYSESFTYEEFFNLVRQAISMEEAELDQLLLQFIGEQILYYRTLIPNP